MQNKRRILIIENQFVQFKDIIKLLGNSGFDFFPDENTFVEYIDAVKIYLNPRYPIERRNSFLDKLIEMTTNFNPEILIIDHILIGAHDGEDGIDLALKFREKNLNQPIIFFSRTEQNNIDVSFKLPKVSHNKEWISKGYSGADILEEIFFKERVIPKIESFLPKTLSEKIIKKLTEKKYKPGSSLKDVHRTINEVTEKLVEEINNERILINEEIYTNISTNNLDSEYLKILESLMPENGTKKL